MQIQVSLKIEIEATASLEQMEQQLQQAGQEAMREALKQTIKQWEEQRRVCPQCGGRQCKLEGTVRRVIATVFGRVGVPRRRFRCQDCWCRWCPAKSLFATLGGRVVSQGLQEAAILAGCSWPYRVAVGLLKKLSGAQISSEEIRRLTNERGKQRATQQQAEAEQACSNAHKPGCAQSPEEDKPLLVGLDGGWVCSREKRGGMEGKVGVICSQMEDLPMPAPSTTFSWSQRGGPRQPPKQRHRLTRRRYVASFGPSRQIGYQAKAAAHLLCDWGGHPVVVVADGASWIKKEQGLHFPDATCILDWAHLWREVSAAIREARRAKMLSGREQERQMLLHQSWLWQGKVDQAVQGLSHLAIDLPAEARVAIKKALGYLLHQRAWIGSYEQWRQAGYPVGSGMIERAVALVINRRMKKRGMRWLRCNATAIVALRTDLLNADWIAPQQSRAFP